jgi:Sec-independent protein translocase protein TatA
MLLNLDPSKLVVIAVVMIIVLGPDRLPHFARQVGGAWRSFSEFRQRMESEVRNSIPDLPSTTELANYARSPATLLDRLSSTTSEGGTAANSLGAKGDLPQIGRREGAHWTATSFDGPASSEEPADVDAETVWLEAQTSFVGDATLN